MIAGFISDVHSNKYALNAVLEDMPDVDRLVSLGDVVGYGPHPKECLDRVRAEADIHLRGNHEDNVNYPINYIGNPMAHNGLEHSKEQLSEVDLEWVAELPTMQTVFDNQAEIAHGYPDPLEPFSYVKESNVSEMVPYLSDSQATILATGHSHIQFKQDLSEFPGGEGWFFNPGSVGQPRDGNPRAAYATVDFSNSPPEITLHRTDYDVEQTIADVEAAGLPSRTGERLRKGKAP